MLEVSPDRYSHLSSEGVNGSLSLRRDDRHYQPLWWGKVVVTNHPMQRTSRGAGLREAAPLDESATRTRVPTPVGVPLTRDPLGADDERASNGGGVVPTRTGSQSVPPAASGGGLPVVLWQHR